MDDAGLVGELQRIAQLGHDAHGLLEVEALVGVEEVLEFLALDELHHEVGDFALLAEVVHLHDIGVVQARDGLGLADEPHGEVLGRVLVEVALEDGLDRDPPVKARVHPLVNHPHRALSQDAFEVVPAQRFQLRRSHGSALAPFLTQMHIIRATVGPDKAESRAGATG